MPIGGRENKAAGSHAVLAWLMFKPVLHVNRQLLATRQADENSHVRAVKVAGG